MASALAKAFGITRPIRKLDIKLDMTSLSTVTIEFVPTDEDEKHVVKVLEDFDAH